jgi:hypothetical protein
MRKPDAALLWARADFAANVRAIGTTHHKMADDVLAGKHDDLLDIRARGFRAGQAHTDGLVAALTRQADNMALILNHFDVPAQWYDKFTQELADDRAALTAAKG